MDNKATLALNGNFFRFNKELLNIGATYSSVLVFDINNNVAFSKSSNTDWTDEFTSTGLYKDCHLLHEAEWQMALHDASFTLVWDLYNPVTEQAKNLHEIRKHKDIAHGVGFCFKNIDGSIILLNIAGKYSDINFGLTVLKHRQQVYKSARKLMCLSA